MESSGPPPDSLEADVLDVFASSPSCAPFTAAEIGREIERTPSDARRKLEALGERDALRSKDVGGRRVWWRPPDAEDSSDDRESPAAGETDRRDAGRSEVRSANLRSELEQFGAFVRAVRDYAIFMLDPEGRVISWNEGAERIKGYEEEEIIGEHFSTFYPEDAVAEGRPEANLAGAAAEGRIEDLGWRVRKDGSRFWADVVITAIRGDDGELRGFTKVTRDMTEQREYEQELRREREQTEKLLQTAPVAIAVHDADGGVILTNRRTQGILGLPEDADIEDLGDEGWRFYDASGDPLASDELPSARVRATGEPVTDVELALEPPDRDRMWLRVNATPVFDAGGELDRVVIAAEDITELMRREKQLERRKNELETELSEVLGRITDAFCALDDEWRITHANERAEELIDYRGEGLVGRDFWKVFEWGADSKLWDEYHEAMETQEPTSFELYYPDPLDGWYEVDAYPSETGLSVYFREITERKERQRQLEESERRYRTLAEYFPNGLVTLFDGDLRYTLAAGQGFDRIPVEPADLEGRVFREVWDDETAAALEPIFQAALAGEERSVDLAYEGREWTVYAVPITDERGEVFAGMTMALDITERKERERELAKYETIVETINDGIYVKDEDGYFTMVNDAYAELTGYSREELVGAHASLVVDEDVILESRDRQTGPAGGEPPEDAMEAMILTADGDRVPAEGTFAPLQTGDERREVGVVRDVSERKERERALEESERRYRTLAEHFPNGAVGVYDHDLRYTLTEGSLLGERLPGSDQLEGKRVDEIFPPDTAADIEPLFRAAVEDGETSSAETEFGGRIWQVWATPLRDGDGDIFAGLSFAQDVTEQVERERYLREAKAQFEAAAEAGAVGTWEWDIQEDTFVAGASFAETFGVDPDAAREGVSLEQFVSSVHEDDRERVEAQIDAAVESCGEYESEYRVWNADGELRWVVARGRVECDGEGNPTTFPGAVTDITERKRAEEALEKTNRQLETLFKVLPVGVIVADVDGRFVEVNDVADEIWGGKLVEADGADDYDRYPVWWADSGEPVDPDDMTMVRVLDGEKVTDPDIFEIEPVEGERRTVMVSGMPIRDGRGEVVRGVVTLTDITERREYQRKLEESNERLEQFAYAASHDLQEPLRMVSSYLSLIERRYVDELDQDGREFIEFAVDGADRMRAMIDALLEYSRVETRGDSFESVDLNAVVDEVRDDLRMKIEESGAEITIDALPRVRGDRGQLRQVFQNLVNNAIEYSGDDPPRIDVSVERTGGDWRIAVRDEGIGIEPEHTERIFEVFQRLHSHEEHAGTGIGLALCQRIIERHGGRIWVESEPGEGSTFYFTVPVEEGRDD